MSYLDTPRLHFFGQFTANPSTVNNAPLNYDFATALQSSWNDGGNHGFALQSCAVTSVVMPADSTGTDPIVGATLSSQGRAVIVDLDTEQQLVSTIYGLNVQIALGGATITGAMTPVNFFDINFARTSIPGGQQPNSAAGAVYQSVLTNVSIAGVWSSPWVAAIQAIMNDTGSNTLSIRFVVDGFHSDVQGPLFTVGRVTGTIGPYFPGEPETFVNGRLLRPVQPAGTNANYNFIPAKTDVSRQKLVMDFGNAFTADWQQFPQGFPTAMPAQLEVVILGPQGQISLGAVDTSDQAYQTNAMVQEFDVSGQMDVLAQAPTAVVGPGPATFLSENPSGAFAMFEPFVFRLDPGASGNAMLWANIFEQPAGGQTINLALNPGLLAIQIPTANPLLNLPAAPPVGTPVDGVTFPASVTTDSAGQASITITANANGPGNPRGYLDGQLYPIAFTWDLDTNSDKNTFFSVQAYDLYEIPANPTWKDVQWLLAIYARLYPAMMAIINLANYDDVVAAAPHIKTRLQLAIDNPSHMPVTRELSTAKMQTIVNWIDAGTP